MPSRTLDLFVSLGRMFNESYTLKEGLRVRVVHVCRTSNDQFLECEGDGTLVPKNNVAPITLGTVYGVIILEYVFGGVQRLVGKHAPVTAHNLHHQLPRFDLSELTVSKVFAVGG